MTQEQIAYRERQRIADLNDAFLYHVNHGMTKSELRKLIEKRPAVYSRFANWIDKLPEVIK